MSALAEEVAGGQGVMVALELPGLGISMRDIVALSEVALSLDPGVCGIATASNFQGWDAGAEYDVAGALRRCFGLGSTVVSALGDNAVGRLAEDLTLQGGVETSHARWVRHDGIGRASSRQARVPAGRLNVPRDDDEPMAGPERGGASQCHRPLGSQSGAGTVSGGPNRADS